MYRLVLSSYQEKLLNEKYKRDLLTKKQEMKQIEKLSGKYTAKFYIQKEPEFVIGSSKCTLLINGEPISECIFTSTTPPLNVKDAVIYIYNIDSDLTNDITNILNEYTNNPEYELVITIKSKDQSGLYYCADGHPIEYKVYKLSNTNTNVNQKELIKKCSVEIFKKYDLVCM